MAKGARVIIYIPDQDVPAQSRQGPFLSCRTFHRIVACFSTTPLMLPSTTRATDVFPTEDGSSWGSGISAECCLADCGGDTGWV